MKATHLRTDVLRASESFGLAHSDLQPHSAENTVSELDILPAPVHPSYRCRWIKCRSELHNLNTLRGHVLKRHVSMASDASEQEHEQEQGYTCWWRNCQYLAISEDGVVEVTHAFASEQEWRQHIEEDHLQPIGWKHGDGPSTTTGKSATIKVVTDHHKLTKAKKKVLCDANGRETTPALPQTFPENSEDPPHDVLELSRHYPEGQKGTKGKADGNARKAFLKAHGVKPSDHRRLAEETIRAMTARKQKIGPGIDRGGCTLVNEARRETFVQAPGISRIIEAEY